jgi:hypothetical protein
MNASPFSPLILFFSQIFCYWDWGADLLADSRLAASSAPTAFQPPTAEKASVQKGA